MLDVNGIETDSKKVFWRMYSKVVLTGASVGV